MLAARTLALWRVGALHGIPLVYEDRTAFLTSEAALYAHMLRVGRLHALHALFVDEFNEELSDHIHAWAVNARTGAPSRYKGFPFHSYAPDDHGGLAAASDGIYALDGADDDGSQVNWELETAWYAMNLPDEGGLLLKRFLSVLLGGRIGNVEVVPYLDDARFTPVPYRRPGNIHQPSRVRFKFLKGYKSRLIKLVIRNVDDTPTEIESVDFEVEHLESRQQ
jgi:hypothetical protein